MTEKPFSIEPDEDFSQPVERLGATASDAAHLVAFGRPQEEALSAAAERSGWIPATPMGGQRVDPVLPVYGPGSGSAMSSSAPEPRVIDIPVFEAEPHAPEDYAAVPPPFAYSLGDEGQSAGEGLDRFEGPPFAADQSGLVTDEAQPFKFPDNEAPVNPDDEGRPHESLVEPEGAVQDNEEEFYRGSPIKDFLIKYNNFILYGGGGIAALALCYGLFFSGGGHHQQQANVIAADAVAQAQFVQHGTSSQGQPASQPAFPSSGFPAPPGPQAAQNGAPQVIFNPSTSVQPAPPPLSPSKGLPGQPDQVAVAQAAQRGNQAPVAAVAPSSVVSTPAQVQAAPATVSPAPQPPQPVASAQRPPATPAQPPAPIAAAPTAAGPAPAAPPAPSDTAQLSAVTAQLQQLSTSVSSIGSKVSDSQSNMASTISQMDDKISNLQAIVLQLEMKVAVASSLPAQTAPTAAPAASPPPPPPPAAPAPAAPPATGLGVSQVASLPVLQGYSLQGYSQGAVVVGTPMGEVTVKLNDTVPGAGTAKGLYRFAPSAGQYGIELVTDEGVIRPTAKSPY